jgi:hypothetical protein
MEDQFGAIHPESPLNPLIEAGRSIGMSDEQLIANIGGMFLTSISNTVGISSAFILRSLLRDPGSLATLREQPDLVRPHLAGNEHVIMELLRRWTVSPSARVRWCACISRASIWTRSAGAIHLRWISVAVSPVRITSSSVALSIPVSAAG